MKDKIIGKFRIERELRNRVWPSSGAGTRIIPAFKAICLDAHEGIADVGDEVALTVIASYEGDVRKVEKRIAELSGLSHPNIVRYRGCFVAKGNITDAFVIVQDLAEGETLKERIAKSPNGMDVDLGIDVLRQAFDALDYIQSCGVAHRNITPESILLCDGGNVKLTNFELPQWWSNCTISPSSFLFVDYWAPESIGRKSCWDVQSDMFSMGVVMYEMLSGKTVYPRLPAGGAALAAFYERVKSRIQPTFDSLVVTSRPKLLQLLKDMMNIDPEKRVCNAAEAARRLSEFAATVKEQDQSMPYDDLVGDIDDTDTIMEENPLPSEDLELLLKERKRLDKRRRRFWAVGVLALAIGVSCTAWALYGGGSLAFKIVSDLLMVTWLGEICRTELKTRLIPNLLTLGGLALWLLIDFASGGVDGLLSGGKAAGIGMLIMLPAFLLHAIGGGGVKMIVACCAYVGSSRLLPFVLSQMATGLIMGMGMLIDGYWNRPDRKAHDAEKHMTYPCSPAVFVAMLVTLLFKWLGWI